MTAMYESNIAQLDELQKLCDSRVLASNRSTTTRIRNGTLSILANCANIESPPYERRAFDMVKRKGYESMSKKNKHIKTNAIRILETEGIAHELLERNLSEDANAAADGGDEADVYKTLVATAGAEHYYVFVIPVTEELDLKKAARVAGEKKIEMLPLKQLTTVTGYIRGGCSAIGMKKQYSTFLDESAKNKSAIYASAGKPGFQMKLAPVDYAQITGALFVDLCKVG